MRDPEAIVSSGYYRGLRRRAARASSVLAGITLLGVITASAILWRGYLVEARYNHAFGRVSVGDERSRVAQLMGGPGRERSCVPHDCEVTACVMTVSYDVPPFLEVWTFQFGNDDRVLSKFHEDLD